MTPGKGCCRVTGLDILVVDDDRDFAEMLGEVLELHGHSVEVAFTGEQAVARFRDRNYDVAIMDVRLPGRNGAESLSAIRETKPLARVIMMTGYSMEHLLRNATSRSIWRSCCRCWTISVPLRAWKYRRHAFVSSRP
jgi:CheY-like chemotaxis protein